VNILHTDDRTINENNEIALAFSHFFKSLIEKRGNTEKLPPDLITRENGIELQHLTLPFTNEEIQNVVSALAKGKSSGPDGFPAEFFQTYWEIVGPTICELVKAFSRNELDLWRLNQACITVIPKSDQATNIEDYRPISIITTIIKIISKLLADRLQRVLPDLISNKQTTFFKGRSMMETFLVARESIILRKNLKVPSFALKVDFKKAFDTVSWDFLLELLKAKGFPQTWITWLKNLLISSSSFIKVNGIFGPTFFHQRGLRQGDPLSPLLFILAADTLQTLLDKEKDNFYSIPSLNLTAFQFADDTLIISEAHPKNIRLLTDILSRYAKISGLTLNKAKTSFVPIQIPQELHTVLETLLECKAQQLLIKYLGLPLTATKPTKEMYLQVLDSFQQRLQT
jgi:hypothetical protein